MNQPHAVADPEHAGKLLEQELGDLISARQHHVGRDGEGKPQSRHPR